MTLIAFTCGNTRTLSDLFAIKHYLSEAVDCKAIKDYWYIMECSENYKWHVHGFVNMFPADKAAVERFKAYMPGMYKPYLRFFKAKEGDWSPEYKMYRWYHYCMKNQYMFDDYPYDQYSTVAFKNWIFDQACWWWIPARAR